MRKNHFNRIGITERQASLQLVWTIGWSLAALMISLFTIFQP
jgi:hypothetical protein